MNYDIKDAGLAPVGKKRIEWADRDMPVLREIRERFDKEKPLKNMKMSACLHVTAETANLVRTLKAGGADIILVASNPLSTQDDVAASLSIDYGIPTFAITGEDKDTYYRHLHEALKHKPVVTMDDGADLISLLHNEYQDLIPDVLGSMEETTTGVIRLKALEAKGDLKLPVFAVNDAKTKNMFDNRYGTGQSTIDGIIRATDMLIAGKVFVVLGYGWCGRGLASRASGMGARVVVTEVDKIKALEAAMDGFDVMSMEAASKVGDLFCTVTGNLNVIRENHFRNMKDGAFVCNSGHFDVEIDIKTLEKIAETKEKNVRKFVDEYVVDGKRIYVLGEGRLINLAAAEGHPACVMDLSFATQALATEYAVLNKGKMDSKVHYLPSYIEESIADLKLKTMGIEIDTLTDEQVNYLRSWDMGT